MARLKVQSSTAKTEPPMASAASTAHSNGVSVLIVPTAEGPPMKRKGIAPAMMVKAVAGRAPRRAARLPISTQ